MKTLTVTAEIVGTGKNLYNVILWPDSWESPSLWLAAGDTEADAIEAAMVDLCTSEGETVERMDVPNPEAHLIGTFNHG